MNHLILIVEADGEPGVVRIDQRGGAHSEVGVVAAVGCQVASPLHVHIGQGEALRFHATARRLKQQHGHKQSDANVQHFVFTFLLSFFIQMFSSCFSFFSNVEEEQHSSSLEESVQKWSVGTDLSICAAVAFDVWKKRPKRMINCH